MQSFDVFCDLRLNKRLSKQSIHLWFETPLRSLWRHCNYSSGHCKDGVGGEGKGVPYDMSGDCTEVWDVQNMFWIFYICCWKIMLGSWFFSCCICPGRRSRDQWSKTIASNGLVSSFARISAAAVLTNWDRRCLYRTRKKLNHRCHLIVDKWQKM